METRKLSTRSQSRSRNYAVRLIYRIEAFGYLIVYVAVDHTAAAHLPLGVLLVPSLVASSRLRT